MSGVNRMKRIFFSADFKSEFPRSIFLEEKRFVKGLLRNGYDVHTFSYRNIMTQFNPFSGKHFRRFMPQRYRRHADEVMAREIRYYYPDVVFLTMKYITPQTIELARQAAPNAIFVGRDGDPFPETKPDRLELGKLMDVVIMPSAGKFLQTYKDAGVRKSAFIPFTTDSDLHLEYPVEPQWKTDMVFLGVAKHSKISHDPDRYEIARRMSEMPNAKVFACFDQPRTEGIDSYKAISSAKIGVSLNIANDVYLYHSDRYTNIPACGALGLAKRVPGYELMFEDGKHMRYFDSVEECFELADYYIKHEDERKQIVRAGMAHAHQEFNCERITRLFMDMLETGDYDAPWKVIL